MLHLVAGNADVAAHQPIDHTTGGPNRNSPEQRAVAPYFHLVTAEVRRVDSHGILHIAEPRERRRLDVNPDWSADMRRLFQRERGRFEAETDVHGGAAATLVHNTQRCGALHRRLLQHLEVDLAPLGHTAAQMACRQT